ncbi:hypothetical protein [Streptomyces sp. H27-D2]|uniref:hypothetical protein n=1 Tax=Streptomyces sp. H27-D2 TaxID=3046304 RepID=UPI003FA7A9DB
MPPSRFAQRGRRVLDPGGGEEPAQIPVVQPLQRAQREHGARTRAHPGEHVVQREFVGPARAREHPQPPDGGQRRAQRSGAGQPRGPPAGPPLAAQHDPQQPQPYARVAPVGLAGARRGQEGRGATAAYAGQRPLDGGVRGEDPLMAAQRGRQREVREPDEMRVVLDERGLRLRDVDAVGSADSGGRRSVVHRHRGVRPLRSG